MRAAALLLFLLSLSLFAPTTAWAQRVRVPTAAQEAENARAERANSAAKEALAAGNDAAALELAEQAQRMFDRLFGPDDVGVASALQTAAAVHARRGDYSRAELEYQRELTILEKALGPSHFALTEPLNSLAVLYHAKADHRRALALAERALTIVEKAVGPEHPSVATLLNNIAEAKRGLGDDAAAEPLLLRALAIREKALGPHHRDVAVSLANLAVVTFERGKVDEAIALLRRALAIEERALGPDHPDIVTTLNNLAFQTESKGDSAGAEALYTRAAGVCERRTPDHPRLAGVLDNLAVLAWRTGRLPQALTYQTRANEIRERHTAAVLATGSDRDRRLFLADSGAEADGALSLHLAAMPADPAAARMALTLILQRKGRLLDVAAATSATLRGHLGPEERALYDRASAVRSELARLTLASARDEAEADAHRRRIAALRVEADDIERRLAARSAAFRARAAPVSLDAVQAALPAGAALLEIVRYRPFRPQSGAFDPARYAAYVLSARGDPAWADLGDAAAIDDAAAALRGALARPDGDPRGPARALDARIMQPVRRLLGAHRHVLVAPDGALNLVPFAALVDERDQPLVTSYTFSYLTSGRDLLRAPTKSATTAPLVVVSPDFGAVTGERGAPAHRMRFSPLPGAAEEGAAVARLFAGASLLSGRSASETAVKSARAPELLHIATHGFFFTGAPASSGRGARGLELVSSPGRASLAGANPLLRSGLAFAGANLDSHERADDGVLTAFEASSLDLWGTKLVVLSACDTAMGDVAGGDGVYGLRRALVVAGAETVVTSLWKVDDEATRDLMIAYYTALKGGGGRSGALRAAQLAMRADPARSHPYYWASFIAVGDWRALDGRDVAGAPQDTPAALKVPHAPGCGCRVGGEARGRGEWAPLALLAASAIRRRRPRPGVRLRSRA